METSERKEIQAEMRERFPDVGWTDVFTAPVFVGRAADIEYPGKMAIISRDLKTREPTPVGIGHKDHYNLVYHEVAAKRILDAIPNIGIGDPIIKINVTGFGEKMNLKAEFPLMERALAKNIGDKISYVFWANNGIDVKTRLSMGNGTMEILCGNLSVGLVGRNNCSSRHVNSLDMDVLIAEMVQLAEMFPWQVEMYSKWQTVDIAKGKQWDNCWEELAKSGPKFGPQVKETILGIPMRSRENDSLQTILDRKGSVDAFTLHSGITQYLTDHDSMLVRAAKLPEVEKSFMQMFN